MTYSMMEVLKGWVDRVPRVVANEEDAGQFLFDMSEALQLGFHPDTAMADYVWDDELEGVHPTFTAGEANSLQRALDAAFKILGPVKVYNMADSHMQAIKDNWADGVRSRGMDDDD